MFGEFGIGMNLFELEFEMTHFLYSPLSALRASLSMLEFMSTPATVGWLTSFTFDMM